MEIFPRRPGSTRPGVRTQFEALGVPPAGDNCLRRPFDLPLGLPVDAPFDMDEYDFIAAWYVAARSPETGIADLAALARLLPSHARVLDLGCGDGVPISRFLLREQFEVEGLDSSPAMIARYRDNFPGVPVRCEQAQEADFPVETFDAVVAWGVLFHLPEADQKAVIRKVAAWLKPGGRFLFTSGEVEGATEGEMNGVLFRYVSLGVRGYRNEIERAGMRLEASSFDARGNYVYRAAKPA